MLLISPLRLKRLRILAFKTARENGLLIKSSAPISNARISSISVSLAVSIKTGTLQKPRIFLHTSNPLPSGKLQSSNTRSKGSFFNRPVSLSHRLQLQSQIRPNLMKMRFPLSNSHHLPRLIFSSNFSPNPAVISFYERKIFSTNVSFISHTRSGISSFFSTYNECRKSIVNKINNTLPAIFPA